jgi:glycine dehydrogenase subunit 1
MQNFLPHTDADRKAMLDFLGLTSQDQLFDDIPGSLRENITYSKLPLKGLSEVELQKNLKSLMEENKGHTYSSFLGGGAYHRFIPMAVNTIASRSEFYTAYTPYQPEISQGTLQVIYEFQSMISELTGMEVTNASVYDGASAVTEAAFMAVRATKRKTILIAHTVHPDYRQVLKTYAEGFGDITLQEFDPLLGPQVFNAIDSKLIACVILQTPNYFGCLESVEAFQPFCKESGALLIVSSDPISLGVLKPPGHLGADIVTGDIQPLGNNLAYGGPYGGYISTKMNLTRQMPGRLVGKTIDKEGNPCYTLTLQTREQHIRREKATSNICTNQALNVLKSTVYLSLIGPVGIQHLANLSIQRAHYLADRLTQLPGVSLLFPNLPYFSEFAIRLPKPLEGLLKQLESLGILGGIPLERHYPEYPNSLLISTTEMTTPDEIERYIRILETLLTSNSEGSNVSAASSSNPLREMAV